MNIEVTTLDGAMGDMIGDLPSRRAQVQGTRTLSGHAVVVTGKVPLSELSDYQSRQTRSRAGTAITASS